MRDLAYPIAVAIVVVVPLALSVVLLLAARWATWVLRAGDPAGRAGLWATVACTAGAVLWLAVDTDRSAQSALAQAQVAALVGLATSLLVVVRVRRSGRRAADAAGPAVPSR